MEINKNNLSTYMKKNEDGKYILDQDVIFSIFIKCVSEGEILEINKEDIEESAQQLLNAMKVTMDDLKKKFNENEKFSGLKTIDVEKMINDRKLSPSDYPNAQIAGEKENVVSENPIESKG